MGLGKFKGVGFTLPDGTSARIDDFKVHHDMHVTTEAGSKHTLRSTVQLVDDELRGSVEFLDADGVPKTNEDMTPDAMRGAIADVLYWLMHADLPEVEN